MWMFGKSCMYFPSHRALKLPPVNDAHENKNPRQRAL